jgi:hypothetical protein
LVVVLEKVLSELIVWFGERGRGRRRRRRRRRKEEAAEEAEEESWILMLGNDP